MGKTHKHETLPSTLLFPNKLNCTSRMSEALSSADLHWLYIPLLFLTLLIAPATPCSLFSVTFLSVSSPTSALGLRGRRGAGGCVISTYARTPTRGQGQWTAKPKLLFIPPAETLTQVLPTIQTLKFTEDTEHRICKTSLLCWILLKLVEFRSY